MTSFMVLLYGVFMVTLVVGGVGLRTGLLPGSACFVGMLGNLLPLPGGIGGVDGAMIGALIGFGLPGGLAIAAVLAYRAFAFWLPIVPGAAAYARLLRTVRTWREEPLEAPEAPEPVSSERR